MKKLLIDSYQVERRLPRNLDGADLVLFQHELKKSFGPVYLTTLHNAYVLGGLVFKPFQFYVAQSLSFNMGRRDRLKRLLQLFQPGPEYDKCIWILDNWSAGYFHWLTDALPRLMACREQLNGHRVLLPEHFRAQSFISRSLELLGQEYVYYPGTCRSRELLLPDHVSVSGNYNLPLLHAVRKALVKEPASSTPHRNIYISRKYAPFRKLSQEDAFTDMLKRNGVEVHYFEHYSIDEQIRLMQETRCLVGLHGAGLTNILFMQPGSRVMELRFAGDQQNNCYFSLASACDVDYYYHTGINQVDDTHTGNLELDLARAEASLHQLLNDPGPEGH